MSAGRGAIYEVYAVRYATNPARTRSSAFVRDKDPMAVLGIDFYFWVARSAERTVVIDTGMAAHKALRLGHTLLVEPVAALERLGVSPGAVATVVMTHLHYDHAGNTDAFPNARFHLQAEEMAFATGPLMEHAFLRHAYHADEIQKFVALLHAGRLHLHAREATIADGISVHWVGGHSVGQEAVRIRTAGGWVVLASDALHYKEELTRGVPYALSASNVEMLEAHRRLRQLADGDDHVIPAHDPALAGIFPAARDDLEGLVLKLF